MDWLFLMTMSSENIFKTIYVYSVSTCVLLVSIVYMINKKYKYQLEETLQEENIEEEDLSNTYCYGSSPDSPSDFYWEERGDVIRLLIKSSKRVSITNDPYSEIFQKKNEFKVSSYDAEYYSESDYSDFETSSIRDLEFQSLDSDIIHTSFDPHEERLLREQERRRELEMPVLYL